jgi:hypothetical protein
MKKNKLIWLMCMAFMLAFSTGIAQTKVILTFRDASTQEIEVAAYGKIYFSDNYMFIDDGNSMPYSYEVSQIRNMVFDEVVGLRDIETETFKVYPNPVHNELYVNGNENVPYRYSLFSIDGRLLLYGEVQNGESIRVDGIPAGLYILKINNTSLKINKL